MQFQVFFGDYNVLYGPNGVDISAFKCTSSTIDTGIHKLVYVSYFGFYMS